MEFEQVIGLMPELRELQLVRVSRAEEGAFGVLLDEGNYPFAVTLERTYSELFVKIPVGIHRCTPTIFHHGKPAPYATYEIFIPNHSRILFHKANLETDLLGCVGVARRFGTLTGRHAVLDSASGFADFMKWADGAAEFNLRVSRF
jgi:hypothetical protein